MKNALIYTAAAMAVAAAASSAQAQQSINILTGGTSGVYFSLGVTVGKIYSDKIPGTKVLIQSTKASLENLDLVDQGRGELAFTLGDSLKAAVDGDENAGFRTKLSKLRTIGAIYPSYIQIVATGNSGIKTLADLKGKSLSVGARKSGTELNARAILKAAGLDEKDLGRVEYQTFAESIESMKSGKLDATLQSAGLGVASVKGLSEVDRIVLVEIPKDVAEKLGAPFTPATIPANTYFGQEKDVSSVAIMNYLVTSAAVSDDLAYRMTKAVFESLPQLAIAQDAGKNIRLENAATGSPAPLHPGAIKFYKEKGLIK